MRLPSLIASRIPRGPCRRLSSFSRVPVTILTGHLGSGKTTLLNRILACTPRIAVIQNEFGLESVDDSLVSSVIQQEGEEVFQQTINGCVCCNVRGDLVPVLSKLLQEHHQRPFRHIIVETTGLAKVNPVLQTFLRDPVASAFTEVDGVVTVVDSLNICKVIDSTEEARDQIAYANMIILTKSDLCTPQQVQDTLQLVQSLNMRAQVVSSIDANMSSLINQKAFDLEQVGQELARSNITDSYHHEPHSHHSLSSVQSLSIATDACFDLCRLEEFFADMIEINGESLMRMKGILRTNDPSDGSMRHLVVQAVHMSFQGDFLPGFTEDNESKVVFIGKDFDAKAIEQKLGACTIDPSPFRISLNTPHSHHGPVH